MMSGSLKDLVNLNVISHKLSICGKHYFLKLLCLEYSIKGCSLFPFRVQVYDKFG